MAEIRVCACGCGVSTEGRRENARYASDACRARGWKAKHGVIGYRPVKAVQNGRHRGGVQLSYPKTVIEMRRLTDLGVLAGRQLTVVEERLRELVPDRQRRAA